jgi:hypothetical protein
MSEGFVPGASGQYGTDNPSNFNHQPPTTDLSEDTIPPSPRHPSHAHFPDELGDLERRIEPQGGFQDATLGPNEKEAVHAAGRGVWQHVKDLWSDLKDDFGSPDAKDQAITNLIGELLLLLTLLFPRPLHFCF